MKTSATIAAGLGMVVLAAAAPGTDGPAVGVEDLPGDWCLTMQHWQMKGGGQHGGIAGGCPTEGSCDIPGVRDGYTVDEEQLFTTIQVFLHVFREDDGSNPAASVSDVALQMLAMNADFAPHKIRFEYSWQYVDDSTYRVLGFDVDGMKQAYAIDPQNQCNIYVTGFGGGVGTFPWGGNALSNTGGLVVGEDYFGVDFFDTFHVISHEMGHNLGLWHTHHGVNEVDQCSACYETPDGVDGDTVGDFCSDTPPRPSDFGLCANPGGNDPCSGVPWGDTQPENYMSYGSGDGAECWTLFTEQQAARMHCWIDDVLSSWIPCGNEQDCNGNLISDDCDIAEGTSLDANGNGIPDECETVPQDINMDGSVDIEDLLALLAAWGPCTDCPADFDGSGSVDIGDLLSLLAAWT